MHILFLGNPNNPLIPFLRADNNDIIVKTGNITLDWLVSKPIDFVISYGYTHWIKADILQHMPKNRAINLHISYLPYNRGADPNFWSIVEDTPKGVSIHLLHEGLDTGDILCQKIVPFVGDERETLRTSYETLHRYLQQLFIENWDLIKHERLIPIPQQGKGSYHKKANKQQYIEGLEDKWLDMPLSELLNHIAEVQMSKQYWDNYRREIDDIT